MSHTDPVFPITPMRTYEVTTQQLLDLKNRFTYHAPQPDQPDRYLALRDRAGELALLIAELTPSSREQALAFTHLEQAIFFANAAIARHEPERSTPAPKV